MNSYIPNYPRPQLVRKDRPWENLNGEWEFAFDDGEIGVHHHWQNGFNAQKKITVPFSYETKASGINQQTVHNCLWYQRSICVELADIQEKRLLLHFEGCDYKTTLFVNGQHIGEHTGAYARFSFDITDALHDGDNLIVVKVNDSLNDEQPRGKQRWLPESFSCFYIQTTGIWKTVWAEYVSKTHIDNLKLTPSLRNATLFVEFGLKKINCHLNSVMDITVSYQGIEVARNTTVLHSEKGNVLIDLYSSKIGQLGVGVQPWTPTNPNLYDLKAILTVDGIVVDEIYSYFGVRDIITQRGRVLLNDKPFYQRLILDQGYWEDTHLTPPSEEALIEDIDKILQLGYNGVRKHEKVEDERFLYWCDVKGLVVWCEMPSHYTFSELAATAFMSQWQEIITQNYNHPSIVTWTALNESWGVRQIKFDIQQQNFAQAVYHYTKTLDSTRPVLVNDGWEHTISDILTIHDYEEYGEVFLERYTNYWNEIISGTVAPNGHRFTFADGFSYQGQPIMITEFGGISFVNDIDGWGYGNKVTEDKSFIERFKKITSAIQKLPFCAGYCYTQVTDVQQETNGLMDINRQFKVDSKIIHDINVKRTNVLHLP